MIDPIKRLFLKHTDEWAPNRLEAEMNGGDPSIWEYSEEEIAYMEQIKTIDDLLNYTPSEDGKMQALVYDCAIAMGLSKHDAMSAANDH